MDRKSLKKPLAKRSDTNEPTFLAGICLLTFSKLTIE